MASCWLNACLQVLLAAIGQADLNLEFYSELGKELLKIRNYECINPTNTKEIMIFAEDTQISIRKSQSCQERKIKRKAAEEH